MRALRTILIATLLCCSAPAEPVVLTNIISIARMRAWGIPGIPPDATDHVQVLVPAQQPGFVMVHLTLLVKGEQVQAHTVIEVDETGDWAIFPIADAAVTQVVDAQYEVLL